MVFEKYEFLIKKSKKSLKKVRNFLTNFKFFIFFEFFSEYVFIALLRVCETTRKNYRIFFEKYTFFDKKSKKSLQKKIVQFFLQKIEILFFFEFFSENVFKTLLKGKETTRKKY